MTDNKCIVCGSSPCYISFLGNVECSNIECKYYSKDLYGKQPEPESSVGQSDKAIEISDSGDTVADPKQTDMAYFWSNYHHDFGDI